MLLIIFDHLKLDYLFSIPTKENCINLKFLIFKYLSFDSILSYNLKRHYFRDDYAFLDNILIIFI